MTATSTSTNDAQQLIESLFQEHLPTYNELIQRIQSVVDQETCLSDDYPAVLVLLKMIKSRGTSPENYSDFAIRTALRWIDLDARKELLNGRRSRDQRHSPELERIYREKEERSSHEYAAYLDAYDAIERIRDRFPQLKATIKCEINQLFRDVGLPQVGDNPVIRRVKDRAKAYRRQTTVRSLRKFLASYE